MSMKEKIVLGQHPYEVYIFALPIYLNRTMPLQYAVFLIRTDLLPVLAFHLSVHERFNGL